MIIETFVQNWARGVISNFILGKGFFNMPGPEIVNFYSQIDLSRF